MKEEEDPAAKRSSTTCALRQRDAEIFFGKGRRSVLPCRHVEHGNHAFDKHGFSYEECQLLPPDPVCKPASAGRGFSANTKGIGLCRYFGTTFYRETAEARREKLWRPKAQMIHDVPHERGATRSPRHRYWWRIRHFAEEYQRIAGGEVTVIEPGPDSAEVCRSKGLRVVETFLEMVEDSALPSGPGHS